jgi:hypothetical protein
MKIASGMMTNADTEERNDIRSIYFLSIVENIS